MLAVSLTCSIVIAATLPCSSLSMATPSLQRRVRRRHTTGSLIPPRPSEGGNSAKIKKRRRGPQSGKVSFLLPGKPGFNKSELEQARVHHFSTKSSACASLNICKTVDCSRFPEGCGLLLLFRPRRAASLSARSRASGEMISEDWVSVKRHFRSLAKGFCADKLSTSY